MTGSERAATRLSEKLATNARTYAGLPPPVLSRQVQRRFIRKQTKTAIAKARAEMIANRRRSK